MLTLSDCAVAFKEWAAVCAALASGRQTIIIRKGGIHEGLDGFRVAHREFWLLPTYLHQSPESLVPDARPLLEDALRRAPAAEVIRVEHFVTVEEVFEVQKLEAMAGLASQHILAAATVEQRFHYRQPGLFVLVGRVYQATKSIEFPATPYIAGCRSWVDLPRTIPTMPLASVLADEEFSRRLGAVRSALSPAVK